jgi:hypothetical protein
VRLDALIETDEHLQLRRIELGHMLELHTSREVLARDLRHDSVEVRRQLIPQRVIDVQLLWCTGSKELLVDVVGLVDQQIVMTLHRRLAG